MTVQRDRAVRFERRVVKTDELLVTLDEECGNAG